MGRRIGATVPVGVSPTMKSWNFGLSRYKPLSLDEFLAQRWKRAVDRGDCDKANGRLGGVGKETQIISAEVYARVVEAKFLPIFCEVSEDGSPLLPTYLKSRRGIDFSSSDKVNENWETLVRDLFDKPL